MKIEGTQHSLPTQARSERPAASRKAEGGDSGPATTSSLSADAAFIQSIRDEASGPEPYREDAVAEARDALTSGEFDAYVDVEAAIDGLLADL